MFELVRFARYAMRFEKAFRTDDGTAVRRCFHADATYTIVGGPPFEGETRGADEIMHRFKHLLDQLDRRFDRRIPKLLGRPRARGGAVTMKWRAIYVVGDHRAALDGVEVCRFERGLITSLHDTIDPDTARTVVELCERAGRPNPSPRS